MSARYVAVLLSLTCSAVVYAQAVPTIGAAGSEDGSKSPYRGTSVSYGHAATALTFAPGGAPYYNPTESHRLGLMPEWHFTKDFFVRGRFFLSQELTLSDATKYLHEVELSDLWVDAAHAGFKEENTGIRFAGDVRVTLPTSKTSQAITRILTLAPSLNLSRSFKVLSGLTFAYSSRFTFRFNRMITSQNEGPSLVNCFKRCDDYFSTGQRNSLYDLIHGPSIIFNPHERVNIAATFLMQRAWLPPLSAGPPELSGAIELQNDAQRDVTARDAMAFSLGVTWQTFDVVGFTLGAFTFSSQLGMDGKYQFPLFNRNTVISLDATFDIEGVVSGLSHKEKT